jgi:hypothetical protein
MRALQALDITLCLSHGHVFFNFDTREQTEIWTSELQLASFHVGLQTYGSGMRGQFAYDPEK